jgi:hypothetical protein
VLKRFFEKSAVLAPVQKVFYSKPVKRVRNLLAAFKGVQLC